MGVLSSISIKNIFYDQMDLRFFYFRVATDDRNSSPHVVAGSFESRVDSGCQAPQKGLFKLFH